MPYKCEIYGHKKISYSNSSHRFFAVSLYLAYEISAPRENKPLGFYLENWDERTHKVIGEIFDPNSTSIFKETYTPNSGKQSPLHLLLIRWNI